MHRMERLRIGAGSACCGRHVIADELIVATGFRPDLSFLRELRIALDPALECPPALAPLIDPNEHSCGTVRPHGARELAQPEPGFYLAGMKSYGRAPTFLMLTGYEQVRSIVADIAGDHEAARRVQLVLPETGVCSGPPATSEAQLGSFGRLLRRPRPGKCRCMLRAGRGCEGRRCGRLRLRTDDAGACDHLAVMQEHRTTRTIAVEEAPAARPTPSPGRPLFITGLGIGQICSWGSLYYSFPLIAEAMERDLGYSKPQLYGAATVGLVLCGLAAYPIGAAIDRGHGRTIMASGSVLAGALLLAWSQVESLVVFYLLFAGIGLLQATTLYEPAFAVVARRFGAANARSPITALTLWGGFASTVFIPLIQLLLDHFGWRETLVVLGGINLVLCAGIYWAVIDPRADTLPGDNLHDVKRPTKDSSSIKWALRSPVFWALAIAFTAYVPLFAFTFHLYPLLLERGLSTGTVVAAMMLIGPAQVVARVAIWMFASHASIRAIGSIVVMAFPLAPLALEILPVSFVLVSAVCILYGAGNGIMTIVRGLAVPEMLTREAYGAINGALAAPGMLARALAPVGAAALWAAAGSYDAVLWAIIGSSVVTVASFWSAAVLSRRRAS